RRTSRRREDDARGRRGAMRAVANVALPRRRWSTRGRHPLGTTRRPAGRAMALGMARSARRFPRSNAQCRSCAAGLTDAGSTRTGTPVNPAMPASRSTSSGALVISRSSFAPPAVVAIGDVHLRRVVHMHQGVLARREPGPWDPYVVYSELREAGLRQRLGEL